MSEKDQVVEILRKAISPPFKATMGDGAGTVVVDGRPGYIWCRKLGKTEMLMQAYNRGAPAIEGIIILIQESRIDKGGYEVIGTYGGGGGDGNIYPPLPPHAWTHEWRPGIGRDRVTVYPRAWGYLRAEPIATGSMNVWVTPGWYYHDGEYHWYPGGYSPGFGAPTGSTWYQTLYMDPSDETLHIVDGVTGGYGYAIPPAPPDCMLPIAAIESTGTFDAVTENMIEDIRLFMDYIAECGDLIQHGHSGTASGGLLDHGLCHTPASLLDDDHPQYLKERLSGGLGTEIPVHDHTVPQGGLVDVPDLTDSGGQLLTGPQRADLTDGGVTILHQHVAGATASVLITLMNRTGAQRTVNDVVVTHPSANDSFTGTAIEGYAGKILVVAETIENLATGTLWERGGPFDVNVEGAVTWNDGLRTSGTPFLAEAAATPTGTGVFAIALSQAAAPTGTVSALFLDELGAPGGAGAGTIEIQEDDVKVTDASTVNFEGGGGKVTDEGGGKVTVDIPGAWTLIEDIQLGAPAGTIDFQNIPGTYKYLVIIYSARSARVEKVDILGVRFNNDSGTNYDWARHRGGTFHQVETGYNGSEIQSPLICGAQSPANSFGGGHLYIYDYASTSKRKGINIVNGLYREANTRILTLTGWGEWQTANAAITRITLFNAAAGDNFVASSRATLYGIS